MTQEATPAPAAQPVPGITTAAPAVEVTQVATPENTPAVVATLDTPPAPKPELDPDTSTQFEYDPTGNAGLDYALKYIGQRGYGANHPAVVAARDGNFSLLKAELAGLGPRAQGYAEVVALAEQAFASTSKQAAEKEAALNSYCIEAAGSQDNWNAVRQWASANADPGEKEEINGALAKGGLLAQAAISMLLSMYSKQNTLAQEPASAVRRDAAGAAQTTNTALTAAQYAKAVQELSRSSSGREVSDTPEYAALQQRRLAGRRQGI